MSKYKPYFCSECRKPCDSVQRDFGYGTTEFWGSVSTDVNLQWVSECCDGDLLDEIEEEVEEDV